MTDIEDELRRRVDALAAVGDPLFAATFEDPRIPEIADLRRPLERARARNKRLEKELAQLRSTRAVRWTAAARRALRLDR